MTQNPIATERADVVTCPNCGTRNRVAVAAPGAPRCGSCQHALPWLTTATDDDFDAIVIRSSVPVLVDLWAPWCGPCRIVEPGVQRVAKEFAGRLKVAKVNVDTAPHTAVHYGAQSIPMLLWVHDGGVKRTQVGALAPPALLDWVIEGLEQR
jgi:thioredoxin 2